MENLEEKSEIGKAKLRGVETIVRTAEICLGMLPMGLLMTAGIGLAAYGTVRKESGMIGVGAAIAAVGAGFSGLYIHAVRRMLNENYESDNEVQKRD